MRYYIIAGEASGDLHASNLMKELRLRDSQADFRCWGGDKMQAEGGVLVRHYRDLAFMGFLEVVLNLRTIMNNLAFCRKDILDYQPDVLILVDYPGFNLRIADFAQQRGMKVFYYISPQVWAWKKSRVKQIRKNVDRMFVILPFEKAFYAKYDYTVDFVGHPLLDALSREKQRTSPAEFRLKHGLDDRKIIALLPGSRDQEIRKILPIMVKATDQFTDYQAVVAGVSVHEPSYYASCLDGRAIKVIYNSTYDLLQNAEAASVTSGTASLEAALLDVPQVICYKGSTLSYEIARRIVDIKYIGLPNLVLDKAIIQELIQHELTVDNLHHSLDQLLHAEEIRMRIAADYHELKNALGGPGASARTAELMLKYLLP
jgi:lipid-A-disaccharide synthase